MQRAFRTPASDSPMYLERSSGPLTDKNLVALIRKTACHVNTQHQGEIRWNNWNCDLPKQQTDLTYPWSTPRAHRQRLYDKISFMLDPLKSDILDVSTVKWGGGKNFQHLPDLPASEGPWSLWQQLAPAWSCHSQVDPPAWGPRSAETWQLCKSQNHLLCMRTDVSAPFEFERGHDQEARHTS